MPHGSGSIVPPQAVLLCKVRVTSNTELSQCALTPAAGACLLRRRSTAPPDEEVRPLERAVLRRRRRAALPGAHRGAPQIVPGHAPRTGIRYVARLLVSTLYAGMQVGWGGIGRVQYRCFGSPYACRSIVRIVDPCRSVLNPNAPHLQLTGMTETSCVISTVSSESRASSVLP